jgi:hypothetical protein
MRLQDGEAALMQLSISLFPDLDGLDGLIDDSATVVLVCLAAWLLVLVFVAVDDLVERYRSPVRKLMKRPRA